MLELVKTGDQNALLFMVNYNYQFDEDASPVLDILRSHDSLSFGHTLIKHLSKNKNDEGLLVWQYLAIKHFYLNITLKFF